MGFNSGFKGLKMKKKKVFHFSAPPNMARILLVTVLLQSMSLFTSESPLYIGKGKGHPRTGTEALYRTYGP